MAFNRASILVNLSSSSKWGGSQGPKSNLLSEIVSKGLGSHELELDEDVRLLSPSDPSDGSGTPDVPDGPGVPESPCIPLESVGGSGGPPEVVDDSVGGSGGIDPSLGFVEPSDGVSDVSDESMFVFFGFGFLI